MHQTKERLEDLFTRLSYDREETRLQLKHRIALVEVWGSKPGDRILEIGCGQGETTLALAATVGAAGRVLAVDNRTAGYGSPITIGEAHSYIKSSPIGKHIDFLVSTDLLDPTLKLPENDFELAVFSHSSWYMSSPQELKRLFARVRTWARHLGYAEWDLVPQYFTQLPHLLAVLLQVQIQSIWCQQCENKPHPGNIQSLIIPQEARLLAEEAGWKIITEKVIDTSTSLGYGKYWEIKKALKMAEQLLRFNDASIPAYVCDIVSAERQLLNQMLESPEKMSLSTYVFLAQNDRNFLLRSGQ